MPRPEFVTDKDIARWSHNIDNDVNLPKELIESPIIREVCYAGLWLREELDELNCPDSIALRIQYTAGQISFGRDVWSVHQDIIEKYKANTLIFEDDIDEDKSKMN